jgi:hypothetical protein
LLIQMELPPAGSLALAIRSKKYTLFAVVANPRISLSVIAVTILRLKTGRRCITSKTDFYVASKKHYLCKERFLIFSAFYQVLMKLIREKLVQNLCSFESIPCNEQGNENVRHCDAHRP